MPRISKIWPFIIIVVAVCVFFWKVIFGGMVAMPGDLLTGAYYPWYEYNYGYTVHVPIKNALISDSFSQFFVWKKVIADSYKAGEWPLWNPYSYSGYPLLANFHSAALYPLNILLLVKNIDTGWNLYIMSGILLSMVTMYLLLKNYDYPTGPSLIGAFTYGFSGYAICWLEFATAGQALVWLPLIVLFIEKYFRTKKYYWLLLLSPILYMLTTAGHFQVTVYGYLITVFFFLFKLFSQNIKNKFRTTCVFTIAVLLGLGLSAIQLMPTLEMSPLTIRFDENTFSGFKNSLLPAEKLITLFAPDYFGNPTTGNYTGFLNYHETVLYGGIAVIFALFWSIYNFKKITLSEKFFLIIAFLSLVFAFDNPIGKLIYTLKVPYLSTSGAGRVIAVFTFATSILVAALLTDIRKIKTNQVIRCFWMLLVFVILIFVITYGAKIYNTYTHGQYILYNLGILDIAVRNLILPTFLTFIFFVLLFFRKNKIFYFLVGTVVLADLFRFGWKYEPFVPEKLVFPTTPVTNFLTSQKGIFRVDKELGPLLPPNTWIYYGLMSPSGYDPVSLNSYTKSFFTNLNGDDNTVSRYAEINTYNSLILGNYNVKYLLALKLGKNGSVGGDILNNKIDPAKWQKVFETTAVAVLENKDYRERTFFESGQKDSQSSVEITTYTPNRVVIKYSSARDDYLVLADTYYPGWKAKVNGKNVNIEVYNLIFRKVKIPKGEGMLEFDYFPDSFRYGIYISLASLSVFALILFVDYRLKKDSKKI